MLVAIIILTGIILASLITLIVVRHRHAKTLTRGLTRDITGLWLLPTFITTFMVLMMIIDTYRNQNHYDIAIWLMLFFIAPVIFGFYCLAIQETRQYCKTAYNMKRLHPSAIPHT